jgi:cytochrome c1
MPDNLCEHISREEMRDLVEYLMTLPAPEPAQKQ